MILPNLVVADSTGAAYKEQFCTKLTISNPYSLLNGYNSTYAPNVFISIPDTSVVPYLTGWTCTVNGNSYPANNNGIIQVSTFIGVGGVLSGNLCAYFTNCHPDDSIQVHYGWNCNSFPDSLDPDSICFLCSVYIPFDQSDAVLTTDGKDPHPVHFTLCDTFEIFIPYHSNDFGGIRPDSVFLPSIPNYLTVTGVMLENDSGQRVSLSAATSQDTWEIKGSDLASLGYGRRDASYRRHRLCACGQQEGQRAAGSC